MHCFHSILLPKKQSWRRRRSLPGPSTTRPTSPSLFPTRRAPSPTRPSRRRPRPSASAMSGDSMATTRCAGSWSGCSSSAWGISGGRSPSQPSTAAPTLPLSPRHESKLSGCTPTPSLRTAAEAASSSLGSEVPRTPSGGFSPMVSPSASGPPLASSSAPASTFLLQPPPSQGTQGRFFVRL